MAAALLLILCGCAEQSAEECLNRAAAKAGRGDWEAAEKLTARAVALAPENVNALVFRAIACDKTGQTDAALDNARRAAELNPDSFAALYTLGRLYSSDPKRGGEAEQNLRRALKLKPEHTGTLVLLCNTAAAMNSRHLLTYLKLLARDKNFPGATTLHNQLGIAYLRCNAYADARKEFIYTFDHGRRNPPILLNTAIFFDRYDRNSRNSKAVAKSLYRYYLRLTAGKPEKFAAQRKAVTARLRNMR